MLISLAIRNIVLIEKLNLDWRGGLCTLTGETGAGKSILLDALALATGARGDAGLVRDGAAQGTVTAVFELAGNTEITDILDENGLAQDGQLILRRVQSRDGRSRAFVNDEPVSVNLLKKIGSALVEIHGQNESQSLTDSATQLGLLDVFARHADEVRQLAEYYRTMRHCREQLDMHRAAHARAAEEADYLRHAVDELTRLDPQSGEDKTLAEERSLLMNSEKISADLNEAAGLLDGDGGMQDALNATLKRLERVAPEASGHLDTALAALERAVVETDEARAAVAEASGRIVFDPARLEAVEERLFGLKAAARKHGVEVDQLAATREVLVEQLADVDGGADRLQQMEKDLAAAQEAYQTRAVKISDNRHQAAKALDQAVVAELPPLKLEGASFTTMLSTVAIEPGGPTGVDHVRFTASTKPGMAGGPISKIASGGELARFMLALKVALAGRLAVNVSAKSGAAEHPRTMIFDEVDAGVGGAVAEAVGGRLKQLADSAQVLVVTHSPQVAACGDHQWRISKQQQDGTNQTQVEELPRQAREEEIARMLAGATVTDEARAAAAKLLGAI